MKNVQYILSIVAVILSLAVGGSIEAAEQHRDQQQDIIPGTLLQINVISHQGLNVTVPVQEDYTIQVPLLGKVTVKNLEQDTIAEKLQELFAKGYLVDPQVRVSIGEKHTDAGNNAAYEYNRDHTGPGTLPETIYTVQKDDTLGSIAYKTYGSATHWNILAQANKKLFPHNDYSALEIGMQLIVPPLEEGMKTDEVVIFKQNGNSTYTVQPGDNLGKIAEKLYGDSSLWTKIYETNKEHLSNAHDLSPGQILIVAPHRQTEQP
jgi:LysM repeat protein